MHDRVSNSVEKWGCDFEMLASILDEVGSMLSIVVW